MSMLHGRFFFKQYAACPIDYSIQNAKNTLFLTIPRYWQHWTGNIEIRMFENKNYDFFKYYDVHVTTSSAI